MNGKAFFNPDSDIFKSPFPFFITFCSLSALSLGLGGYTPPEYLILA